MQSFTSTKDEIIVIESEKIYFVPWTNLNSTKNQLEMPPSTESWYNIKWMKLLEVYMNKENVLKWFSIIRSPITNLTYKFYQTMITWYLVENKIIGKKWIDHFNSDYDALPFTNLNDKQGYGRWLFGSIQHSIGLDGMKQARVFLTPIVFNENNGQFRSFNFPKLSTIEREQIPIETDYYYLETNDDRTTVNIKRFNESSYKTYRHDLFAHPPPGIIDHSSGKWYLLSVACRRVYIIDGAKWFSASDHQNNSTISLSKSIPITSISWEQFFTCHETRELNKFVSTNYDKEPSQSKYLNEVDQLKDNEYDLNIWRLVIFLCTIVILMVSIYPVIFYYYYKANVTI